MQYFVVCPYCGQELLKAEDGSNIEISCPECKNDLAIEIENSQIIIQKLFITETAKDN